MTEVARVEVVYATPAKQVLVTVELEPGSTIADAIRAADISAQFPGSIDRNPVGIWGRPADRAQVVSNGDRVEIYRPLARDPKEARRELARIQRLGSSS